MTALRYIDVVLIVAAAPIMILIGVPALGYLVGMASWLLLRAVGLGVDQFVRTAGRTNVEVGARLAYLLSRVFLLALTVIFVRKGAGQDDGLAALVVIVFAFTAQLVVSVIDRPRSR